MLSYPGIELCSADRRQSALKQHVFGIVYKISGNEALVAIRRHSMCHGCGRCSAGNGTPEGFVRVKNRVGASVGDRVRIGIEGGVLAKAYGLMFTLPILGLLIGYMLGFLLVAEVLVVFSRTQAGSICALLGLGASFCVTRVMGEKWLQEGRMAMGEITQVLW